MKSSVFLITLIIALNIGTLVTAQNKAPLTRLNNAIDNQGYWRAAAAAGLTLPNPMKPAPAATFTGSEIRAVSVLTDDSPDVVIIEGSTSQSENSVFVNPADRENPLNSNNSTNQPSGGITLYGADYLYSTDGGENWGGSMQGAGGTNQGDPTTAIGLNGRYFINFINNGMGQGISYSDNQGQTWTNATVASGGGNTLDKNHMWIDNCSTSPYEGNLYIAWTPFGGGNDSEIELSRSTDNGQTWSAPVKISGGANAGYLCQGVNIQTGPNGEVYAAFCIYDNWPSDEDAMGFARSFDGGVTWESFRAISNVRGIRSSGTGKNVRVNAFPVMACDISSGPNRGNIYLTWTNTGVPGINTGSDVDVYMIRSEDNGDTWSEPIKVNQDPSGMGKKHYLGWITSDPSTGTLSMVFYDDRNVSSSQVEVFCANSMDGGDTWEDFKVSDVAFSPSPIPGLASQYFGDYLGISARNGKVYPVWTDNRTGTALAYTSPYMTSTMVAPTNLLGTVTEETGQVNLSWVHQGGPTFDHYNVYRGLSLVGTSALPFYLDMLPNYGSYRYQVTAVYTVEGESAPAIADVQWGNAQAEVTPGSIEVYVLPEGTLTTGMELNNTGQLPLEYTSSFDLPETNREQLAYCNGFGGCGEGIYGVLYGDVSNFSQCNSYEDFTSFSTMVTRGESFEITIFNTTNIYPEDICGIWVDWNHDEDLTNDGTITVSGSPGPGPYTATITVPDDAKNGMTRMRIRIKRGGTLSPCGSSATGEVEDYSIDVLGWVTADPMEGTVAPGTSQNVTFTFDAEGLPLGTYQANYTISSNDPDHADLLVPVTMHVADANVVITVDKDSLCLGGSVMLNTSVTGGSGNYTYTWTSNPPGFNSSEANPVVVPLVTTVYYVEVNDGSIILNDNVTITVLETPQADLGEDVAICSGAEAILDAGAGYVYYLWSNGHTTQTITVTEAGEYWCAVVNEVDCYDTDTVSVIVNSLPVVDLGPDISFCEGSSAILSAGTGFSTYLWSNGETSNEITVTEHGIYWVQVTDQNGCGNTDEIVIEMQPKPSLSLGNDQSFCEGTSVTLDAGFNFEGYFWSTGSTNSTIEVTVPGDYWVEVTDVNGCTNRDTLNLTMDPLPIVPQILSGPSTVDNFIGIDPPPTYTCSESLYAVTYDWQLEPANAGTIAQYPEAKEVSVEWAASFIGTANLTVRGLNDCGEGNYSQAYPISVYSSQGLDEPLISEIKLYPNPTDGKTVLQLRVAKEQELQFRILSSNGNLVSENTEYAKTGAFSKNISLIDQPASTYYLIITNKDGKVLHRDQIIVQ